jgi:DnaJ-class molecular chaperone
MSSEVKKTYELEELDLATNWEVVECPHCGGSGALREHSEFDDGEYECDECGGTGELAISIDPL